MSRIINQPVRPSNHWWFSYLVLLFFYKKKNLFCFFIFCYFYCGPILMSSHFFFGLYGFTYIDLSNRPISIVWRIAFLFFWIIAIIQSMYFSFFSFHNHLNCWFDLPIEQGEINITHPLFFPLLSKHTLNWENKKTKQPVDWAQNITRKCSRWLACTRRGSLYHFLT